MLNVYVQRLVIILSELTCVCNMPNDSLEPLSCRRNFKDIVFLFIYVGVSFVGFRVQLPSISTIQWPRMHLHRFVLLFIYNWNNVLCWTVEIGLFPWVCWSDEITEIVCITIILVTRTIVMLWEILTVILVESNI